MRLTIIADDNSIGIDGVFYSGIDLSFLPDNIRAVQWYDSYGEIEYKETSNENMSVKPPNIKINTLDWLDNAKQIWTVADNEYKAYVVYLESIKARDGVI